ncbi:MAG: hypothetical protein WC809_18680 [Sinimarinibacterium sp.]|jgi:hypothetical protein
MQTTTEGRGAKLSRPAAAARRDRPLTIDEIAAQDHARTEVDRTLRHFGLTTKTHFQPQLGIDRALHVRCRLATAGLDRKLVYAVLDEQGWNADCARLSHFCEFVDTMRVVHQPSGAVMAVVIRMPAGEPSRAEAA